jgi:hypothetical protein
LRQKQLVLFQHRLHVSANENSAFASERPNPGSHYGDAVASVNMSPMANATRMICSWITNNSEVIPPGFQFNMPGFVALPVTQVPEPILAAAQHHLRER